MATFLCSLNKKHTHTEVYSFLLDVGYTFNGDDLDELGIRLNVAAMACYAPELPEQYRGFDSRLFWMDAIVIEN